MIFVAVDYDVVVEAVHEVNGDNNDGNDYEVDS